MLAIMARPSLPPDKMCSMSTYGARTCLPGPSQGSGPSSWSVAGRARQPHRWLPIEELSENYEGSESGERPAKTHTHTHTLTRRCRPDPPSELAGSLRMRGRLTGLITERGGVNLVISTHIVVQTKRFRKSLPVAEHFRGNQSKWMAVCDSGCCPQGSRLVFRTRVVVPARLPMQRKSATVPCRSRIIVHLG